jgi:hypothetical protein
MKSIVVYGYSLPLNHQDFVEIEKELIDLEVRDDPNSNRRAILIYVLEESIRFYRKISLRLVCQTNVELK